MCEVQYPRSIAQRSSTHDHFLTLCADGAVQMLKPLLLSAISISCQSSTSGTHRDSHSIVPPLLVH